MSFANAPSSRGDSASVWTGSLMVIWGGSSASGELANGSRYDPVADLWTPMDAFSPPPAGAPERREGHTAVWTGNVVVVWGGSSGFGLNTGARYDPLTASWSPTSPVDAPGGGFGLVGLGERVRTLGGRLKAEPRLDGGFVVEAVLPT